MQMTDLKETDNVIVYDFAYKSHIPEDNGKMIAGRVAIDKHGCLDMFGLKGMSPNDFFLLVGHIEGLDRQAKLKFHPGALEAEEARNAGLGSLGGGTKEIAPILFNEPTPDLEEDIDV